MLFFSRTGTEYQYEEKTDTWRRIGFGHYLISVINAFFDYLAATEDTLVALKERLDKLLGRESYDRYKGKDKELDRLIKRLEERPYTDVRLLSYFSQGLIRYGDTIHPIPEGWTSETQHKVWYFFIEHSKVMPSMHPRYGWGWLVSVPTPFEAAVIEAALGYIHRNQWRKKIRACKWCRRLFRGKQQACKECRGRRRGETKDREAFRRLLRQHKHQLQRGRLKNCRKEAIKQIEHLQQELYRNRALKDVVEQYAYSCKRFGLPTDWLSRYQD